MGAKGRIETAVRRATPTSAVPGLVRRRTTKALADPQQLADARLSMQFLVGAQDPDHDTDHDICQNPDLEALTERYVRLMKWRGEARWHPERLLLAQQVEGVEHFEAVRGDGRGVLVHFSHHGFYDGLFAALSRHGIPCQAVVTPAMFDGTAPPWLAQQYRCGNYGAPMINAAMGVRGFVSMLEQGAVLGLATDVPDNTRMRFLGRDVRGAMGIAYIAHKWGYPIVQVTARQAPDEGLHPTNHWTLHPAIDPAYHSGPRPILDQLVGRLEAAVAAWPEGYDQPLKRWKWEPDADA